MRILNFVLSLDCGQSGRRGSRVQFSALSISRWLFSSEEIIAANCLQKIQKIDYGSKSLPTKRLAETTSRCWTLWESWRECTKTTWTAWASISARHLVETTEQAERFLWNLKNGTVLASTTTKELGISWITATESSKSRFHKQITQNEAWLKMTHSAPQSIRRMVTFDNQAHGDEALATGSIEYPRWLQQQHNMDEVLDLLEANPTESREANERKRHWKHWRNIQCCRTEEVGFMGVDNWVWNLLCLLDCASVWVSDIPVVCLADWELWQISVHWYWRNHVPLQPQRHIRKEVSDGNWAVFTSEEQERERRNTTDCYCLHLSEWWTRTYHNRKLKN